MSLVSKLNNPKLKENYASKIRDKKICQGNTTLEYYLNDATDKNRYMTAWT